MIKVTFDPSALTGEKKIWWDAWTARAETAEALALTEMQGHNFRQPIWRDLKDWLMENVFEKKCAYCETKIEAGFYGDAEHYRPKGAVTVRVAGKIVPVGGHPGYYWLAYHWKNLVPSCEKCNTGDGKNAQFPVRLAHVSNHIPAPTDPASLDMREEPLLLHPYNDEPEKHLVFGLKGVVASRDDSKRGESTIEICDLKRKPLCEDRAFAQLNGWLRYLNSAANGDTGPFVEQEKKNPYSAAVMDYIRQMWKLKAPK